jgi:hypothetical protein
MDVCLQTAGRTPKGDLGASSVVGIAFHVVGNASSFSNFNCHSAGLQTLRDAERHGTPHLYKEIILIITNHIENTVQTESFAPHS